MINVSDMLSVCFDVKIDDATCRKSGNLSTPVRRFHLQ